MSYHMNFVKYSFFGLALYQAVDKYKICMSQQPEKND